MHRVHASGNPGTRHQRASAARILDSLPNAAGQAALVSICWTLDAGEPLIAILLFGVAVRPLSGAILSLPAKVLGPRDRSVGFGVFYTCFYVLMAVGPLAAGRLQDAWGSPSAALIAGAALLVAIVPLSLSFVFLSNPHRLAKLTGDAPLREWRPGISRADG
jgi:MFS family permease